MKLLMITRKVDKADHLAGFIYNWVKKLGEQVDELRVISWQEGDSSGLPDNVKVTHLKTKQNKLIKLAALKIAIWKNLRGVDGVFCHMMPIYTIIAAPIAKLGGKKVISWYMHRQVDFKMKLMTLLTDKVLSASKESFRLKTKKLVTTGHGIDTDLFNCIDKKQNQIFKIITVGRISPTKDYESMIKAVGGLDNVGLDIIGEAGLENQKSYFDSLKQMVEKMNLQNRVKFLGGVSNTEIPKYLSQADLFINMSGTGSIDKAVLEAMACKCLVITSNESFKDILADEYKANANDPKMLSEKINYLMNLSFEERVSRGEALRKIVIDNHNLDNLVKKIVEEFKK